MQSSCASQQFKCFRNRISGLEGTGGHLGVEPLVVEEDVAEEVLELPAPHQVEGQFSEPAQVVPGYLPVLGVEHQRHGGNLPVRLALLALESEPGWQFIGNNFGSSFSFKNHLSFGLRFPTQIKSKNKRVVYTCNRFKM